MAHNEMTLEQAIEYIESENADNDFCFRADSFIPETTFENSKYHGDNEDDYGMDLGGVSVIKVMMDKRKYIMDAFNLAKRYGKNVFLIDGYLINAHDIYHDAGEALATNHKIVAIIRG